MSKYKFKKGDRVRNTDDYPTHVRIGATGTVLNNNSMYPLIEWDDEKMVGEVLRSCMVKNSGVGITQDEKYLELITDEQFNPEKQASIIHTANQMFGPVYGSQEKKEFLPGPVVKSDGAPQPNTIEWWRWHYAGLAMQGISANPDFGVTTSEFVANAAIDQANKLIAELQNKESKNG